MKVMIDLNIFIDVFQKREPHYPKSSLILNRVLNEELTGYIAGHAITTLYYLLSRFSGKAQALDVVDWILSHFEVESAEKENFIQARAFGMKDFEDAVIAACAENVRCEYIITRNVSDYKASPVSALTPREFLEKF